MDDALKAFIFTISGAFLGSVTTIFVSLINRNVEVKKHFNEIIVQSAIENWKGAIDIVKANKKGIIPPLDAYIISAASLYGKIDFTNIKKDELIMKLHEVDEINREIDKFYEEKAKDDKTDSPSLANP